MKKIAIKKAAPSINLLPTILPMAKYITSLEKDKETIVLTKNQISEIINIALASAKIKKIIVEEEWGEFFLRTNMHIFLYGARSSTKSTILKNIKEQTHCPGTIITHLTTPALIGAIDNNTKQAQIGACWECKNNFLFLDEFDFAKRDKELIRAILQLTESGEYVKKIAVFSAPLEEKEEDLFFKVKNGEFQIKTRFSLVLATMIFPYTSQNKDLQALVSRCVAIPLYLSKSNLIEIANGKPLFRFVNLTPKKLEIKINKRDYKKILNFVEKNTGEEALNFLRIVGDCVRVFAILKKHREDLYKIIITLGSKRFSGDMEKIG